MLPARMLLFIAFQALFAAGYLLAGSSAAWESAANWWPITVTLANLACIALLIWLYKGEGKRYWDIFRIQRSSIKSDLLVMLGTLILFGPVAYLPNFLIATWLFGGMQIPNEMFIRALPMWAVLVSLVIWPITQGLAELPTYFGYAMPRLEERTGRAWLAVSLASVFLAAQHHGDAATLRRALHRLERADVPAVRLHGRHSAALAAAAAAIHGHRAHLDRRGNGGVSVQCGVLIPAPGS